MRMKSPTASCPTMRAFTRYGMPYRPKRRSRVSIQLHGQHLLNVSYSSVYCSIYCAGSATVPCRKRGGAQASTARFWALPAPVWCKAVPSAEKGGGGASRKAGGHFARRGPAAAPRAGRPRRTRRRFSPAASSSGQSTAGQSSAAAMVQRAVPGAGSRAPARGGRRGRFVPPGEEVRQPVEGIFGVAGARHGQHVGGRRPFPARTRPPADQQLPPRPCAKESCRRQSRKSPGVRARGPVPGCYATPWPRRRNGRGASARRRRRRGPGRPASRCSRPG